jgi:hypothetical protein
MLPRWYLPTEPPISVAGVSTVSPVAPLHHRVVLPQAMVWHYIVSQCLKQAGRMHKIYTIMVLCMDHYSSAEEIKLAMQTG